LISLRIGRAVRLEAVKPTWKLCFRKAVEFRFGPGFTVDLKLAREGDKRFQIGVALRLDVGAEAKIVLQGMFPALGDDHGFGLVIQVTHHVTAEVLDDDLDLLADGSGMKACVAGDLALPLPAAEFGVVLNGFFELVVRFVGHVILEHVQNEPLLYGLSHRVAVKRVGKSIRSFDPKALQGDIAWRRGERKETDIHLRPTRFLILGDQVFDVVA